MTLHGAFVAILAISILMGVVALYNLPSKVSDHGQLLQP